MQMQGGSYGYGSNGQKQSPTRAFLKWVPTLIIIALAIVTGIDRMNQPGEEELRASHQYIVQAMDTEQLAAATMTAYGDRALEEGYVSAAKAFYAVAEGNQIQAQTLLALAQVIDPNVQLPKYSAVNDGSTKENITFAYNSETTSSNTTYPQLSETFKGLKNKDAQALCQRFLKSDAGHSEVLSGLMSYYDDGTEHLYFYCQGCGNTSEGSKPMRCGACGTISGNWLEALLP
ncbi:MAG: rubrerythrin family protein [Firmicutes bacterium]|nr:rubrerythrin family protein [Bacillota bacterium]